MNFRNLIKSNYQFIFILFVFIILTIRDLPAYGIVDKWVATLWAFSYKDGFIARGFMGSIARLFFPVLSYYNLYIVFIILTIIFFTVMIIFNSTILKKMNNNIYLFLFILFFLINPATISMYINMESFGRFEVALIILTLVCFFSLISNKFCWIIPILMIVGELIHEAFIIMYAPIVLCMLLFSYFWDLKNNKSYLIVLVLSIITVTLSHIAITLFGNKMNWEYFFSNVQSITVFPIIKDYVRFVFTYTMKYNIAWTYCHFQSFNFIVPFMIVFSLLLPTFIPILYIWFYLLKKYPTKKLILFSLLLSSNSTFVMFFIACDYGRWLSTIIICHFIVIFFLIFKGIVNIDEIANKLKSKKRIIFTIFILISLMYLVIGPLIPFYPFINFYFLIQKYFPYINPSMF
jgi:hypothetical protein